MNIFYKKILMPAVCCLLLSVPIYAQFSGKGFAYQGNALDTKTGKPLVAAPVSLRFALFAPNNAAPVFTEAHSLTTDSLGRYTAVIGAVNSTDFATLNFKTNDYQLKVEVSAAGTPYALVSQRTFDAVPYAKSVGHTPFAQSGVQAGTVIAFAGPDNKVPQGYLICDGRLLKSKKYPALYAAIGGAWGKSEEQFQLPDMRGLFLRGVDAGKGTDEYASQREALKGGGNSGDQVGSYQADAFEKHSHVFRGNVFNDTHSHEYKDRLVSDQEHQDPHLDESLGKKGAKGDKFNRYKSNRHTESYTHKHKFSGETYEGIGNTDPGSTETRPRNYAVLYIIKY